MTKDLGLYILRGKLAVPASSMEEWYGSFNSARHVAVEEIGGYTISTVFLGIDHSFGSGELPLLFETMTFGPPDGDEVDCSRCGTWEEAIDMHEAAVAQVIGRISRGEN